jgi:putative LysE/RhtB family amino acid efflux pump
MLAALLAGLGLGFLVAAQVGPIWLLCARSSIRYGASIGISIGAGAALVDLAYACLGALGAASLVTIDWLRPVLGLLGAAVLIVIGSRTLWSAFRIRSGAEDDSEVATPRAAFLTGLAATASNPLTIASWAAVFSAATVGKLTATAPTTIALLLGVVVGSMSWFTLLSTGFGLLRHRASDRALQAVDIVSGTGVLAFGVVLGWRTVRNS